MSLDMVFFIDWRNHERQRNAALPVPQRSDGFEN